MYKMCGIPIRVHNLFSLICPLEHAALKVQGIARAGSVDLVRQYGRAITDRAIADNVRVRLYPVFYEELVNSLLICVEVEVSGALNVGHSKLS